MKMTSGLKGVNMSIIERKSEAWEKDLKRVFGRIFVTLLYEFEIGQYWQITAPGKCKFDIYEPVSKLCTSPFFESFFSFLYKREEVHIVDPT